MVAGVDQPALVGEGGVRDQARGVAIKTVGRHHRHDRQPVLAREFPVALIVARHRHDGALAVLHQHEVGHPHRQLGTGQRVPRAQARVHAELVLRLQRRLAGLARLQVFDGRGERGIGRRHLLRQRMLGRDRHVGGAVQRVRARGEHLERAVARHLEGQLHAHRAADPVALHGLDRLRPFQTIKIGQQLVGVSRDAQEPLRNLAPLHERARAPAAAVDHLLVGQHGLVDRVPVDRRQPAVGEALPEQPREQPLLPAVVLRPAGGDLAPPVVGETEALQLPAHVGDVVVGPARRRDAALDGGVLGRHAERVPAHRLQHTPALHHLIARQHVADGVVAHMPHVQRPRRVREHRQAVELLARPVVRGGKGVVLLPPGLGLSLDRGGVVLAIHRGKNPAEKAADYSGRRRVAWPAPSKRRRLHCRAGIAPERCATRQVRAAPGLPDKA